MPRIKHDPSSDETQSSPSEKQRNKPVPAVRVNVGSKRIWSFIDDADDPDFRDDDDIYVPNLELLERDGLDEDWSDEDDDEEDYDDGVSVCGFFTNLVSTGIRTGFLLLRGDQNFQKRGGLDQC